MILLAIDTAAAGCGVAVFQDDSLLLETVYLAGKTHSRHLADMIDAALKQCGIFPKAIDVIAVSKGPGTFTGLRIGISTAKGLAMATGAAVIGVSSLSALAFPFSQSPGPVVPMLDARRGEVYYSVYDTGRHIRMCREPEKVGPPEAVCSILPENAWLVGSGAVLYRDFFLAHGPRGIRFADTDHHVIPVVAVGRLALDPTCRQMTHDPGSLVPTYIRPSDAQVSG
ncbi:tRNA (adenosine(37)-N6)-threonylcarbamoyltransferase complex dimerization subunit type 1 TsaB [Desulfosarcina sp. OttesenSCG-928-A07]|nr:tRNA (adenosine(37)-N6)-threonylcarbamoyltransferase complex dimerization subunit type 1 TsaB [Desulfosarcina sp. OttesenSCG-928-G17]MDL2328716.1 tRNA (adenosine(37)-N6)-threonylcarbamoyltransferase complex dimerization subunit type 1 TsaB [Desulfosarcina sp. OttesenSCG-928-A07]